MAHIIKSAPRPPPPPPPRRNSSLYFAIIVRQQMWNKPYPKLWGVLLSDGASEVRVSALERREGSDEMIEVNDEEFQSISSLVRGRVKLIEVNQVRTWKVDICIFMWFTNWYCVVLKMKFLCSCEDTSHITLVIEFEWKDDIEHHHHYADNTDTCTEVQTRPGLWWRHNRKWKQIIANTLLK